MSDKCQSCDRCGTTLMPKLYCLSEQFPNIEVCHICSDEYWAHIQNFVNDINEQKNNRKMETEKETGEFFYQGKYFDNFEDMIAWRKEWQFLPLSEKNAERSIDLLKRDILLNVFLRNEEWKNIDFTRFCEEIFEFAMIRMNDYPKTETQEKNV